MKTGKISRAELEKYVLKNIARRRDETILGVGADCAAIKTDKLVFLSVDPITSAKKDIGALSVYIACNDLCAGGAEPLAVMLTVLLPPDTGADVLNGIMASAERAARAVGVEIVGGHTERTDAVFRPVICAAAAGAGGILPRGNIRPGDSIVMTKTAGLEGTFVLAGDYADVLRLTEAETAEAQSYLDLLCVAREAAAAAGLRISAMHDATEGGVLGAVSEMLPAGMGADIDGTLIPVTSLTKTICARLNLDPFKLLSSGSMIFVTGEETALTDALQRAGIGAAIIGRVSGEPGVRLNGKTANDFTDEIYRINDV